MISRYAIARNGRKSGKVPSPKPSALHPFQGFTRFWWEDRGLSAFLLLIFISLFLGPLMDSSLLRLLSTLLYSLLLVSGVVSLSPRLIPRMAAGSVAAAAIALRWADRFVVESRTMSIWAEMMSLLFFVLLTGVMLVRVFRDEEQVTRYRVRGAVAAYLLVGITCSHLYQLFDLAVPGSFIMPAAHQLEPATRQENLTYFSFVTLTTLGYGDVTASHPTARLFVIVEALLGQLYPATLLARLVSLEIGSGRQPAMEKGAGQMSDGGVP